MVQCFSLTTNQYQSAYQPQKPSAEQLLPLVLSKFYFSHFDQVFKQNINYQDIFYETLSREHVEDGLFIKYESNVLNIVFF